MINKGIIRSIDINSLSINFYKDAACAHCSACNGQSKFGSTISIDKPKNFNKQVGDEITVEVEDSVLLKLSFLTYILPTFFMILGYFLGDFFNRGQGFSIFMSFFSLVISFLGLSLYDKKRTKNIGLDFKILD
ncbi:MAG: SoxR reducing system RseC family protein [Fusobacteriaceae bacterium]